MNIQDFHDGYFDGIRLQPDGSALIFLRHADKKRYLLMLRNIILDLVVRRSNEATESDVRELYGLDENPEQVAKLLATIRKKKLHILELNPSYGAQGLFVIEGFEVREGAGA